MSDNPNQFAFNLTTPLRNVASCGQIIEECDVLILHAPTASDDHLRLCAKLRQGFLKAMKEWQKGLSKEQTQELADNLEKVEQSTEESEEDAGITGDLVSAVLYSSEIDIVDYTKTFKELLKKRCCFVDDRTAATGDLLSKLSEKDLNNLMGAYVSKFFL